ncbi:MAG: DUF421 domain-containing protein [Bacillus sp. (in: firmicutes)]
MAFIWHSFILIVSGIILLRIAGRKSIAQMTHTQTIVMISIGTIIVQPIVESSVTKAIISAFIFVLTILIVEYLQLKWEFFETCITGKSKIVIDEGVLQRHTLKKLRLTVDQLEMRLRNSGIAKIEDVKTATIEANGDVGYELQDDAKPLTVGEFKHLMQQYFPDNLHSNNAEISSFEKNKEKSNLFSELH